MILKLTEAEAHFVALCLSGEIESDDGRHGQYMIALRRVLKKLRSA